MTLPTPAAAPPPDAVPPLRVLHVITTLDIGGAETMLCKLVEASRPEEVHSSVIMLTRGGSLLPRLRAAGAEVQALDMESRWPSARVAARLVRLARHAAPDVVFGWLAHGNLAAWLAAEAAAAPLVLNVRQALYDLGLERRTTRLAIRAGALLSRRARWVVYNSEQAAQHHEALGYDARRRVVIPNGFDTERFTPSAAARGRFRAQYGLTAEHFVVGMVARAHKHKGHVDFLDAAARLSARQPNARFVLVGRGCEPGAEPLAGWIADRGLSGRVVLLGERADLEAVYPGFDVSGLASITESFPNVVGESMACGVPCVATEVGAASELIGDTGRIVPSGDWEALADALAAMEAAGGTGRRSLGIAARQRIVRQFSLDRTVACFEQLSRETVGDRSARGPAADAQARGFSAAQTT